MLRRAVLGGDERAWRVWVDEAFDDLFAYVLWRCEGRRDRADEVVQETWLTAVGRLRRFDPAKATFGVWLRGIATNVLRNHLRKWMNRSRRHDAVDVETLAGDFRDERRNRHGERSKRIAEVLNRLPAHYDEVLRAKYMENLSVAEIAAVRGETPKAVESLLGRARQRFREIFRTGVDGEEV